MSDYWQFPHDESGADDSGVDNPLAAGAPSASNYPTDARADHTTDPMPAVEDPVPAAAGVGSGTASRTTSTPPPPPPPPPGWGYPPASAPPTRLYRSRDHRFVGGVAGGIARHLGVDPLLIRFATVLILMSGLGIFAYIAAWILLPLEPLASHAYQPQNHAQPNAVRPRTAMEQLKSALAIGAVAIGLGIAFGSFTFVALWLIGGGIWLLSQQPKPVLAQAQQALSDAMVDPPNTRKVPLTEQDREQWRQQYAWEAERYGWPNIGEPPAEVLVPTAPRPRQTITRLVLALLLVLVALATAAGAGDWWDVEIGRMLGIALVTVGAGVALGALFRNRARGLIPVGLLLAAAMLPVTAASQDGGFDGFINGVGTHAYAPTTAAMLQSTYDASIGELTLDFSRLDLAGKSRTVDVTVAAGEVQVLLPANIGGSVSAEASVGEIVINLANRATVQVEGPGVDSGVLPLQGTDGELILKIKASVGTINVEQLGS